MNKLFQYVLLFIGLSITFWIIWVRFIRERIPKDIPFQLTEFHLYILIYICCIFLYIVISLVKTSTKEPSELILKVLKWLYKPLTTLDESIKTNKNVSSIYNKCLKYVIDQLITLNDNKRKIIYGICQIIPRGILVIVFCVDVSYFHRLEFLYYFILLGLIPLIHRYLKYSLKYAKKQYILQLDNRYEKIYLIYEGEPNRNATKDGAFISIEEFVNIQTESIVYFGFEYAWVISTRDFYIIQYELEVYNDKNCKLTSQDYENIDQLGKNMIPILINLSVFLEEYSLLDNLKMLKYSKIAIYSLYFLCWFYILIVSFANLDMQMQHLLYYIEILKVLEDPFSGELLIHI